MSGVPVLFNGPTQPPLDVDRIKAARRITSRSEDVLLETYRDVAVDALQEQTRRQLVAARFRLTLPGFPKGTWGGKQSQFGRNDNAIELRRCPVIGVNSIKYYDSDGTQQTLATDQYDVFNTYEPALIRPSYGNSWPVARARNDSVEVEFTAGYMVPVTVDSGTDTLTTDGIWDFSDGAEVSFWSLNPLTGTGLSDNLIYYVRDASSSDFSVATTSDGSALNITGDSAGQLFACIHPFPPLALQLTTMLAGHWYSHRCPPQECGCKGSGKAGVIEFEGLMNQLSWESPLVNR